MKPKDPFQTIITRLKSRTISVNESGVIRTPFTTNTLETRRKLRNVKTLQITANDLRNQWEIQNGLDHWTGLPLDLFSVYEPIKWNPSKISVDRIDGAGNYTADNILLTTRMMNCARNSCPRDKFESLVNYLMGRGTLEYDDSDFLLGRRNPYLALLNTAKDSVAYRKRAEFGKSSNECFLDVHDIVDIAESQNGECHYFKTRLNFNLLFTDHPEYFPRNPLAPSIDRIDCSKPYSRDNVVVCLRFANTGRAACPYNDFVNYISDTFDLSKIAKVSLPDNTLERFYIYG